MITDLHFCRTVFLFVMIVKTNTLMKKIVIDLNTEKVI